jgi:hypothetical protein
LPRMQGNQAQECNVDEPMQHKDIARAPDRRINSDDVPPSNDQRGTMAPAVRSSTRRTNGRTEATLWWLLNGTSQATAIFLTQTTKIGRLMAGIVHSMTSQMALA